MSTPLSSEQLRQIQSQPERVEYLLCMMQHGSGTLTKEQLIYRQEFEFLSREPDLFENLKPAMQEAAYLAIVWVRKDLVAHVSTLAR